MLRKLKITNFESHKDTTIQFVDGFNAIQGASDGGKSSIIRAISAVCYNDWDNASMRLGEHRCEIQLTTDLGIVKLIKDTKLKLNAYECTKFSDNKLVCFETVGIGVPQEVFDITKMNELAITNTTKDIPNIMYQLDKHYMLAEVSGKTCNSNLIARIFDKVIGLGGMEELISEISSSLLKDKKSITLNMGRIDDIKIKMVDEDLIKIKENKIKEAKKINQTIKKNKEQLNKIFSMETLYSNKKEKLKLVNEQIIDFDSEKAKNILIKINQLSDKYNKIINITNSFVKYKDDINNANIIIQKYDGVNQEDVTKIKELCNQIYKSNKIINQIKDKKENLELINNKLKKYKDIEKGIPLLKVIKEECNCIYKANKIISKNIINQKTLVDINIAIDNYKQIELKKSTELEQIKSENKICPLCGNEFTKCKEG